jgi:hypothetical protein
MPRRFINQTGTSFWKEILSDSALTVIHSLHNRPDDDNSYSTACPTAAVRRATLISPPSAHFQCPGMIMSASNTAEIVAIRPVNTMMTL